MSKSICAAHLYFAIKLTLGMPLMKVLKNRLKLSTSYWQSTAGKNYRSNSNLPHFGHENRRLQWSKMTKPADAGGHIRALAAEDKTYAGQTLRRTIMAPEEDEVFTTQEISNRHKLDKAARDLEWRQTIHIFGTRRCIHILKNTFKKECRPNVLT